MKYRKSDGEDIFIFAIALKYLQITNVGFGLKAGL